ncbi:unnamed protein product [Arabis nemorensis]|uniref:Uncharacterized protein n=1 Tax=Arabis nemorensis TaxID=586526 RepID=A0A565BMQ7_9BRAS|nr:unnamed protein product [Arabis nemorensis]
MEYDYSKEEDLDSEEEDLYKNAYEDNGDEQNQNWWEGDDDHREDSWTDDDDSHEEYEEEPGYEDWIPNHQTVT